MLVYILLLLLLRISVNRTATEDSAALLGIHVERKATNVCSVAAITEKRKCTKLQAIKDSANLK